jgi:hypothetical protein
MPGPATPPVAMRSAAGLPRISACTSHQSRMRSTNALIDTTTAGPAISGMPEDVAVSAHARAAEIAAVERLMEQRSQDAHVERTC